MNGLRLLRKLRVQGAALLGNQQVGLMLCLASICRGLLVQLGFQRHQGVPACQQFDVELGHVSFALRLAGTLQIGILTDGVFQNRAHFGQKPLLADGGHVIPRAGDEVDNFFTSQPGFIDGAQAALEAGLFFNVGRPRLQGRCFFTLGDGIFHHVPAGDQNFDLLGVLADAGQQLNVLGGRAGGVEQVQHRVGLLNLRQREIAVGAGHAARAGQVDDADTLQPLQRLLQHSASRAFGGMGGGGGKRFISQRGDAAVLAHQLHGALRAVFNERGQGGGFFQRRLQHGVIHQHVEQTAFPDRKSPDQRQLQRRCGLQGGRGQFMERGVPICGQAGLQVGKGDGWSVGEGHGHTKFLKIIRLGPSGQNGMAEKRSSLAASLRSCTSCVSTVA